MLRNKAINHERLSIKNCQLSSSEASGSGRGALGLGQDFAANLFLRPPKQRTELDDIIESSTYEN